jgi:hypothetical protein
LEWGCGYTALCVRSPTFNQGANNAINLVVSSLIMAFANTAHPEPAYAHHHDPVCQAKRDGVIVNQARKRDHLPHCLMFDFGLTQSGHFRPAY